MTRRDLRGTTPVRDVAALIENDPKVRQVAALLELVASEQPETVSLLVTLLELSPATLIAFRDLA